MEAALMLLVGLLPWNAVTGTGAPSPAAGPLRVCPTNPRCFTDGSGRAVYLTGSHTWNNVKEMGATDPPAPMDYDAYLDFLVREGHNYTRLWTWELTRYTYKEDGEQFCTPFPWPRTGPGNALDGKPKFDLSKLDPAYFDRLRARVQSAGRRGIYVSVMLFEGHGAQCSLEPWCWQGHPFNAANNVNGIDGDPDGDARGTEVFTLRVPAVTAIQETYVRRVVDTLNGEDNLLYEIANEAGAYSTEWQYHMIRFIKECEAGRPKQHPVGMTFQYKGGSNKTLFDSPADWISPNPEGGYRDEPPLADGRKVILSDTDHLWGIGGSPAWVWKSFLRGHNPIFMDPYLRAGDLRTAERKEPDPKWEPVRRALGFARACAARIDLAHMLPRADLSEGGYCLADPGKAYLIYLPQGKGWADLSAAPGALSAEWLNPATGEWHAGPAVPRGPSRQLAAPFEGEAVAYLRR